MIVDLDIGPVAEAWLTLADPQRRMAMAMAHTDAVDALHRANLPRGMHFGMHAAVETLIAEEHEAVVRNVNRLVEQGVRRHAVAHMVMEVLAGQLIAAANGFDEKRFAAQLDRLDAATWIGRRMQEDFRPEDEPT